MTKGIGLVLAALVAGCAAPGVGEPPRWSPAPESALPYASPLPPPGAAGLDDTAGGGAVLDDLDGDGLLDLFVTAPHGPNALFLGQGDGTFAEHPDSGLEDGDRATTAVAVDLNDDRYPEILLGDRGKLRLFRNVSGGTWLEWGDVLVLGQDDAITGVSAADANGDGFVDLYVSVYTSMRPGDAPATAEDHLLLGRGDLTFEDVSERLTPATARQGMTFAATWLDADGDGDLDIYVVRDKGAVLGPNALFLQEDGVWTDAAAAWDLDLRIEGMGVTASDLDHDGALELAVSDVEGRLHIHTLSDGGIDRSLEWDMRPEWPEFTDSWGLVFADLDSDGHDDLLVPHGRIEAGEAGGDQETALLLWREDGFVDATGLMPPNPGGFWRTVLPGDLDGDGCLDFVQTQAFGAPAVYLGSAPSGGWLEVELDGPAGNRAGLGATVTVETDASSQSKLITAGASIHSSTEPVARFGLGAEMQVDVQVRWPDGSVTESTAVASGQRVLIAR